MCKVEAVGELVYTRMELKPPASGFIALDGVIEYGAPLPIETLLIEHDAVGPASKIVRVGMKHPYFPLRLFLEPTKVFDHGRMELSIAPVLSSILFDRLHRQ